MMVPEDLPSIVKRIGSHAKNHMMLASNFSFVFLQYHNFNTRKSTKNIDFVSF